MGLLGFDFLGAFDYELDYEHGRLTAIDPDRFEPPTDPRTIALDVRLAAEVPKTDVAINLALGERFLIDTGPDGAFLVFPYFARRHPEALVDRGGGGDSRNIVFNGVGGTFDVRPYQLASVRLGRTNIQDFLGFAVRSKIAFGGDDDGLIGAAVLRLFTVIFDYERSRIYLVPNGHALISR